MKVDDWIDRADMGNEPPNREQDPRFVLVHGHKTRSGRWPIRNTLELAMFHSYHPELKAITGRNPYEFLITEDGDVQQGIPLRFYGCHGVDFNPVSVGIALLYSHRDNRPNAAQVRALYWLCNVLVGAYGVEIYGHSEAHASGAEMVPRLRATKSKTKKLGDPDQCPPAVYDLEELRRHAYQGECLESGGLAAAGVVL